MSDLTPQIDAILARLADACLLSIKGEDPLDPDELAPLIDSLHRNGFDRHAKMPLVEHLRQRVFEDSEMTMHRAAEITSTCQQIQKWYNDAHFEKSIETQHEQLSRPDEDRDLRRNQAKSPPDVHRI